MTPAFGQLRRRAVPGHYCLCTGREPPKRTCRRSRRLSTRSGGRQHGGVSDPGPRPCVSSMARNGWGRLRLTVVRLAAREANARERCEARGRASSNSQSRSTRKGTGLGKRWHVQKLARVVSAGSDEHRTGWEGATGYTRGPSQPRRCAGDNRGLPMSRRLPLPSRDARRVAFRIEPAHVYDTLDCSRSARTRRIGPRREQRAVAPWLNRSVLSS